MSTILYGLKNCETCRKAQRWLADAGIAYRFVDVRSDSVSAAKLAQWADQTGWETLLNRRSRAWRQLTAEQQTTLDADAALRLMQAEPTLIKRPVLELDTQVVVGFSGARYEAACAGAD